LVWRSVLSLRFSREPDFEGVRIENRLLCELKQPDGTETFITNRGTVALCAGMNLFLKPLKSLQTSERKDTKAQFL
jgi:hypothetical protein